MRQRQRADQNDEVRRRSIADGEAFEPRLAGHDGAADAVQMPWIFIMGPQPEPGGGGGGQHRLLGSGIEDQHGSPAAAARRGPIDRSSNRAMPRLARSAAIGTS